MPKYLGWPQAILILGGAILMNAHATAQSGNAEAAPPRIVYVSPEGNDAWSGNLAEPTTDRSDGPLASPEAARDRARALDKAVGPVHVVLRGGTYRLAEPLVFDSRDSGTPENPVVWRSHDGESAVLSGGRRIGPWRAADRAPGIPEGAWQADVASFATSAEKPLRFQQLWIDGTARQRARTPNRGYFRAERTRPRGFTYSEGDVEAWPDLEQAMLFTFILWESSYHYIDRVDTERRYLEVSTPDLPWNGFPPPWEAEQRFYIENVRAAFDQPGEWYLDEKEGVLYYLPLSGEDPTEIEAVAPVIERTIVRLDGAPEKGETVHDLRFDGLTFSHVAPHMPRGGIGVRQAAVLQRAAIETVGARDCAFLDCVVSHIGEHGIWIGRGSRDVRIERCHIHDLGAGAVRIGEHQYPRPEDTVERIVVDNCFLHDGG